MMRDRRIRWAAAVLVLALVVGVWYLVLWSPATSQSSLEAQTLSATQTNIQQLQQNLDVLLTQKKSLPSLSNQAAALANALPGSASLPQFYSELNQAANKAGVPLLNVSPTPPSQAGQATTTGTPSAQTASAPSVSFSVQTKGGYFQLLTFLEEMNSFKRLVSLTSISLSTAGQNVPGYPSSDGVVLDATIKGQAFEARGA